VDVDGVSGPELWARAVMKSIEINLAVMIEKTMKVVGGARATKREIGGSYGLEGGVLGYCKSKTISFGVCLIAIVVFNKKDIVLGKKEEAYVLSSSIHKHIERAICRYDVRVT